MGNAVSESLYDLSCLLPVLSPLVLLPFFSFPLGWTQAVGSGVLRSFAGHGSRRRGDSSPLQGCLCLENPELTILSPKASVKLFQFSLTLILGTVHPERVREFCCSAAYIQGGSESGHSPGLGGLSTSNSGIPLMSCSKDWV